MFSAASTTGGRTSRLTDQLGDSSRAFAMARGACGSVPACAGAAAGVFRSSAAPVSVADYALDRMWVFNGRAGAAFATASGRGAI